MSAYTAAVTEPDRATGRLRAWYAGGLIVAALVLGGSTVPGHWSDHVLWLLSLPALGVALFTPAPRLGRLIGILAAGVPIVYGLQLAGAVIHFGADPVELVVGHGAVPGTRDMDSTIESFAYALVYIWLFYFFAGISTSGQKTLISFLLIGAFVTFLVAFFQYISRSGASGIGFLPFDANAGFFANRNHFAALIYLVTPFLISHMIETNRLLPWIAIGITVFFQFVVGSLAGAGLSIFAATFSFLVIANRGRRHFLFLGIAIGLGIALLVWNFDRLYGDEHLREFGRLVFYQNTLVAIAAYLPFGSGLGTFQLVYASFIQPEGIFSQYVNHAHNDWLELLLEGGALSLALILLYLSALVMQWKYARESGMRRAALCAIVFLLLHSLVDYPLRTMAIGVAFVAFNAIYFHRPSQGSRKMAMKVRVGGQDRYLATDV